MAWIQVNSPVCLLQCYVSASLKYLQCFFTLAERKEEEEEEEALPLDMMDEDDLKLMEELAQKASFITRDLSSK